MLNSFQSILLSEGILQRMWDKQPKIKNSQLSRKNSKSLFTASLNARSLNEAEKFLSKDKYLKGVIKKHGPCTIKPINKKEYFPDLVDAICSQQLSGKAAATIFNRVKEGVGGKLTPEAIHKTKDEKLRSFGLSWAKVSYVKDLAKRVENKELKINYLSNLSDEEVMKELVAVKGIGPWTAEMFLMFSLARPDVFPIDDLGIKKGVEKLSGKKLLGLSLAKFAERWKPFRTVASWYIWRSLENR